MARTVASSVAAVAVFVVVAAAIVTSCQAQTNVRRRRMSCKAVVVLQGSVQGTVTFEQQVSSPMLLPASS